MKEVIFLHENPHLFIRYGDKTFVFSDGELHGKFTDEEIEYITALDGVFMKPKKVNKCLV